MALHSPSAFFILPSTFAPAWLWVALRRHTFFWPSILDFRPSALVSRSFFVCLVHFVVCPTVFGVKPRLESWRVDGLRRPRPAARVKTMASMPSGEVAILSDFACILEGLVPACGGVSLWSVNLYRSLLARKSCRPSSAPPARPCRPKPAGPVGRPAPNARPSATRPK
jgi:hypothetical protein